MAQPNVGKAYPRSLKIFTIPTLAATWKERRMEADALLKLASLFVEASYSVYKSSPYLPLEVKKSPASNVNPAGEPNSEPISEPRAAWHIIIKPT